MADGTSVDQLYIEVNAKSVKANDAIDRLCGKLDRLYTSLRKVNGSQLTGLSVGVQRLGNAMNTMNNVKTADFTRLAKNIEKMGSINVAKINSAASSINQISKAFNNLGPVSDNAKQFAELAKGISQLGYKSSTKAIENIPKLAVEMKKLMTTMSKAPRVRKDIIDMTNALAKLARTGSSSGRAVNSLQKTFNNFSASTKKAKTSSFSLAGAIGKVYASYWLLFRAFGKLKDAIDISSKLTEVQNVVDVTFGKYKSVVEDMAKTSITDFGMSELTVKEVSSRFQAMGSAMGFAQGEMAKTSVELTKLAADMASFYNVEQSAVAKDLESIFTGETRPLRTYGLDLTQATLKEWALKNGMDANVESMSQMEKATLRYQYVMANTGAAQGDFARTANTWANQVRILKQNFEQLGSVFGGVLINAFKPVVTALNVVIGKFIELSRAIANSLGKIFGWTYTEGTGGGVTEDLETGAESADNIADGVGDAADNAKKLKQQLHKIDELNVLSSNDSSSSGTSGSSGGSAGSGTGGQWEEAESLIDQYESELDNLWKLGNYISEALTETLNNIDWESAYEGARDFGVGLAAFLNGLISPELFSALGKTIGGAVNTALNAVNAFSEVFQWNELGESMAASLDGFFEMWDPGLTADTFTNLATGILDSFATAFSKAAENNTGKLINQKFVELMDGIDWNEVYKSAEGFGTGLAEFLNNLISPEIFGGIGKTIASAINTALKAGNAFAENLEWKEIGNSLVTSLTDFFKTWDAKLTAETFSNLVRGVLQALTGAFEAITEREPFKVIGQKLVDLICGIDWKGLLWDLGELGVALLKAVIDGLDDFFQGTAEELAKRLEGVWADLDKWWKDNVKLKKVEAPTIENIKEAIQEKWKTAKDWWENTKSKLSNVGITVASIKDKLKEKWKNAREYWSGKTKLSSVSVTVSSIKDKLKSAWKKARDWWKNNKPSLSEITAKIKLPHLVVTWDTSGFAAKALQKLGLKGFPNFSVRYYAMGGFPEDGWFRANHGELMGKFDNGRTVVANNKQITAGIAEAVYQGNRENNALMRQELELMRRQNELLMEMVEKETGISPREIFDSVKRTAEEYKRRTGRPAFS